MSTAIKERWAGVWRRGALPLKVILAGGLLYYLVQSNAIDIRQFYLLGERPALLALALVFGWLSVEVNTARWFLLLRGYGIPVQYLPIWTINYLSCFLGNFLPGLLGVDGTRLLYLMRRWKGYRLEGAATVLLDRALGAYALVLLGWMASISLGSELAAIRLMTVALTILVLAVPLLFGLGLWLIHRAGAGQERTREGRFSLTRSLQKISPAPTRWRAWIATLLAGLALSVIGQGLILAVIVCLASGMATGGLLGVTDYMVAGTLGLLSNTIPLTPGGLGIGEGMFDQVCRLLAGDSSASYGGAFLASRSVFILSILPGAAIWLVANSFGVGRKTGG